MNPQRIASTIQPKSIVSSDWLEMHEIAKEEVVETLAHACHTIRPTSVGQQHYPAIPNVTSTDVWALALASMCAKFPAFEGLITQAQSSVETNFHAIEQTVKLPFTLDRRKEKPPLVCLNYQGSPADIICVAHELAHAVQIQCTEQKFTVPVLRELAAFIGELALLNYLEATNNSLSEVVKAVWQQENNAYLGSDVDSLQNALTYQNSPYNYRWNYPIARVLASKLFDQLSEDQLWQVFLGNIPLSKCIAMAVFADEDSADKNYLPPVPEGDAELPALSVYRSLGMMCLLDVDYRQGQSEECIESYFAELIDHMRKQTAFVAVDKQRRPIGYATWLVDEEDQNRITFTRQSAPFGHHFELQKTIREWLPEKAIVKSTHLRSARKEQTAW